MMSDPKKRIVVVGASRGIGKELVKLFAKNQDHCIYALARSNTVLTDFKEFKNVFPFQFDLDSNNISSNLKAIFEHIKEIDIVINNAGKLVNKSFLELTKSDIQSSYQVNVIGVMECLQFLLPKMIEKGGHVVNISSMGGFQGTVKFSGLSTYSSSKAALVNLTEMLAEEFKESKIKFNCLCLGAVQTEMLEEAFPGYEAPLQAEEMAEFIANFALNSSKYLNGKIIPVSLSTP